MDTYDPATGATVSGLIVARIPLADLRREASTLGVRWIGPRPVGRSGNGYGRRLTQNSADAMYWAGHVDSSKVKVFGWKDSDNNMETHDVDVDTWCNHEGTTWAAVPDGIQWIDNIRANCSAVSMALACLLRSGAEPWRSVAGMECREG